MVVVMGIRVDSYNFTGGVVSVVPSWPTTRVLAPTSLHPHKPSYTQRVRRVLGT
jgi:hypothetical protein